LLQPSPLRPVLPRRHRRKRKGRAERWPRRQPEQSSSYQFLLERDRVPQDSQRRERAPNNGKNKAAQEDACHSSVRIRTVSPIRKNSTKGAQAARNGGYPPKLPIASAALSTTKNANPSAMPI